MKQCFKCGHIKQETEFYAHPAMSDGLLGKCKTCTKKDVKENYSKNRSYYSGYEQIRGKRIERIIDKRSYSKLHRQNNPEKAAARRKLNNAIKAGKIQRQPCEVCGRKAQGHHSDYSQPFNVRWLCFLHHRELEHGQTVTMKEST